MDKLIRDLLISERVSHRLVKPLLQRYSEIHTESKARIDQLVEIISDIRQPIATVQTPRSKEHQRQTELKVSRRRRKIKDG